MNEELRERLIRSCAGCEEWDQEVDFILAEIEAAGYVLVERERWERVMRAADCGCDVSDDCCSKLRGGDLDGDV